MWIKKIRPLEKPDWYKAHLDPNINQKEIMFIGKLVFLFKMSILQERKLWIWVQARCLLLPSFSILAICAIWQILMVFQLNFCSTLLRKISSNHLWILQGISKQNIFIILHLTQCARMDLNKRFLPKPMTTTGWKGTP